MAHAVDIHVGRKLRQARWMKSMTQRALADRVGIRYQQIQKYETGTNRINASRLWSLAKALDLPVDHFFQGLETCGTRGHQARGEISFGSFDREALALIQSYYAIPRQQRRCLFDLARVLSQTA